VKEGIWCFQLRRSVVVKGWQTNVHLPLVSDHAGHNIFSHGSLSGTSAGQWVLGERLSLVVGLFKCSWLNLEASLTGSCGVRTGGLRVSMRFMGPEEGGVVAV
jgi:hypothetical protein